MLVSQRFGAHEGLRAIGHVLLRDILPFALPARLLTPAELRSTPVLPAGERAHPDALATETLAQSRRHPALDETVVALEYILEVYIMSFEV
jgi:hypothetical protein